MSDSHYDAYAFERARDYQLDRLLASMEYDDRYDEALRLISSYMARRLDDIIGEVLEVSDATEIDTHTIVKDIVLPELESILINRLWEIETNGAS